MAYVRTVRTGSGATAVQIVHGSRRRARDIEHLGSAHDEQAGGGAQGCRRDKAIELAGNTAETAYQQDQLMVWGAPDTPPRPTAVAPTDPDRNPARSVPPPTCLI